MGVEETVRECQEYILDHLDQELTVKSLAERFSFSPSYLSYRFREFAHVSIGEYIQNMRLARAAYDLIMGSCVSEASLDSGFASIFSFSRSFRKKLGVPPSEYIGALDMPIVRYEVPLTVAGYILRRAKDGEGSGLALWQGYDFSKVDPADFPTASPEGGAEVAVWTEIDGEKCYLFGVCCRYNATIPSGMVRCELPAGRYAMFLIPESENTHELSEKIHAAVEPALAHCEGAKTFEPIPDAPCLEYYHGKNTFLCVPVREIRK